MAVGARGSCRQESGRAVSDAVLRRPILHLDRHRDSRRRRRARPERPPRHRPVGRRLQCRRGRRAPEGGYVHARVARRRDRRRRRLETAGPHHRRNAGRRSRAPQPRTPAEPATTALVFDHLSSESLRLAQRATLDYVPMSGESSVRIGVFATDPGVRVAAAVHDRPHAGAAGGRAHRAVRHGRGGTKAERSDELTERKRALEGETRSAAASGVNSGGATLAPNVVADRPARDRASADSDRTEHASLVRQPRPHPQRLRHGADTAHGCAAALVDPRPQDDRVLLGRSAGLARAFGQARFRDRRGQSRQRNHVCGGRQGAAVEEAC